MKTLLSFLLLGFLVILGFSNIAIAEDIPKDLLIHPEITYMNDQAETNQRIDNEETMSSKDIDELLGPDINFPFLPDNHRDSGTGKFNSF